MQIACDCAFVLEPDFRLSGDEESEARQDQFTSPVGASGFDGVAWPRGDGQVCSHSFLFGASCEIWPLPGAKRVGRPRHTLIQAIYKHSLTFNSCKENLKKQQATMILYIRRRSIHITTRASFPANVLRISQSIKLSINWLFNQMSNLFIE